MTPRGRARRAPALPCPHRTTTTGRASTADPTTTTTTTTTTTRSKPVSRSVFSAHRPHNHSHPRCPGRTYYPDRNDAACAARRLGSHVGPRCRRCAGYHLTLKETG